MQTSNFLEQLQWPIASPKVRMDGHNLFHQMAESDQNKRMVPYKRKMALSFGRLHIPSSMPLLKVQSSD